MQPEVDAGAEYHFCGGGGVQQLWRDGLHVLAVDVGGVNVGFGLGGGSRIEVAMKTGRALFELPLACFGLVYIIASPCTRGSARPHRCPHSCVLRVHAVLEDAACEKLVSMSADTRKNSESDSAGSLGSATASAMAGIRVDFEQVADEAAAGFDFFDHLVGGTRGG